MRVIQDSQSLEALCSELAAADHPDGERFITVDTEFLRDTTYWPTLCLVQVAAPGVEAIIDPLAGDLRDGDRFNLGPLVDLLRDESLLKVFHAARQDMELFVHRLDVLPKPIFDTQIAGMVCGLGESVGYETLVKTLLGRDLDKSSRFTDWSRRPLTDRQLAYALGDVTHLRDIYPMMDKRLKDTGRTAWVAEEIAYLQDPALYTLHPDDAWKRLKFRNTNRRFLATLQALAAWREREAQTRDQPRNRIMKDDALLECAAAAPDGKEDLDRLRAVPRGFSNSGAAKGLLAAVAAAKAIDKDALPRVAKPVPTPAGIGPVVELLRVLLKMVCEDHEVAPKLVANAADLERIAADDEADVAALTGWRREIFGGPALDLKNGRLALAIQDRKVTLVPAGTA